jgi:hypothetical protein
VRRRQNYDIFSFMKWCFRIGEMKKEHLKVKEIVEVIIGGVWRK